MPELLTTIASLGVLGSLITIAVGVITSGVRRRRERKGLLTLLARDIEMFERQWEVFEEDPTWVVRSPDYLWSMKVWEDNRARLSQLLRNQVFVDMMRLFQNIRTFKDMRSRPDLWPEFISAVPAEDVTAFGQNIVKSKQGVSQLRIQTATVREHIHKYVSEDELKGSLGGSIRRSDNNKAP